VHVVSRLLVILPMRAMQDVRLATDDMTGALVCKRKNKASEN
jgi:hypothetical protein